MRSWCAAVSCVLHADGQYSPGEGLIAPRILGREHALDVRLFELVNGLAGHVHALDTFFSLVARFGPYAVVAAFIVMWFWPAEQSRRHRWQWAAIVAVVAALVALGLNQIITHLWARPRPFLVHPATVLVTSALDGSFPSDHATFVFAAATSLFLFSRRLGIPALVFACLVAFSRVFVGVHYVTDVVAGAVIGSTAALLVYCLRSYLAKVFEPVLRLAHRFHLA
jgi:undecaprenyl-diphosphatase